VADCGADVVRLSAAEHDASVALLSHLPQVTASALAAGLVVGGSDAPVLRGPAGLRLAGPGLVDTTRLAASDAELWAQILELNAAQVAPVLTALAARLTATAGVLTTLAGDPSPAEGARAVASLRALLREGNAGRALVPVKRGVRSEAFAPLRVSVRDEPGRLAALLNDAATAGFNVEDVHVEHVPGRPTGVIELAVRTEDVEALAEALVKRDWAVLARS
jgi:prephenate dehydrogenase